MNANFKPIALAAAVATAAAGYAGVVSAQSGQLAAVTQLGDLAIVPYYTTREGFATGVNVINTSGRTQALKIRFRRAVDSMDALDFNVVLSPYDMYTGYVQKSGTDIVFISNDNSCTAPAYPAGGFVMPSIYKDGPGEGESADSGYIEILSMGSPLDETYPVAVSAKHTAAGVPADCAGVRDNFYAGGVSSTTRGNVNSVLTVQNVNGVATNNDWEESPNSLKVSYFIKDDDTGIEFGDNAVHVQNFFNGATMTDQQTGVFDGDLQGFDHPDLNGGAPESQGVPGAASLGLYNSLRRTLGAAALINDWSQNNAGPFTVDTDWVVTIPGQYVMLNLPQYLAALAAGDPSLCEGSPTSIECDNRDIPMTALFTVYDREEQSIVVDPGDLVISPQPPGVPSIVALDREVNVIQWGVNSVLQADKNIVPEKPDGSNFGWASLTAVSSLQKTQAICEYDVQAFPAMQCNRTRLPAPLIGFVAWQRNFVDNAAANYGRIVAHSRVQSAS